MAKKTISRLSVLAVLIVFLAACSKTSEYTNVIPADASVVASINLKSLASKAGLDDKENEAAKQKVLEALKKRNECYHIPTTGKGYEESGRIGNRC